MMEEGSEMMEVEEPKSQMHPNSMKRFGLKNFISTNFNDGYVFQIVPKDDRTQMAVSLSTNMVKLYSSETGQFIGECKGHSGTINHLSFSSPSGPHVLHSCSSDGTLRAWDTRTFHEVSGVSAGSSQEIYSFSFGGSTNNLLSTGCKSQILFWDWRSRKPVACLEESHTDDVTQVHFVPDSCNKLVSASADGLICIFDTDGDINNDENLESVSNVGSSIGKVGFFGESYQKLWCLTHIETLSIWDWKDGRNEANLQDARSLASDSWMLDHVDYFVDCHHSGDRLWAIGGTNTGSIGYFPVDYTGGGRISSPDAILGGGHIDVVRSVFPMSSETGAPAQTRGIFGWTGGEDGRLCCWLSDDSNNMNPSWISSELVTRTPRINKRCRHSPY